VSGAQGQEPTAGVRTRGRRPFQLVWIVPVVAVLIAGYLGVQALLTRGSAIHISFASGDGIVAGQTKIRHKAVDLGTVRTVSLSDDLTHVEVVADMTRRADRTLTDQARFWVVRPRLALGNVSGLDTLVSGSYIEMDPGDAGGVRITDFQGLDEPPAIRSDTRGRAFSLTADRLGSISAGSPVFFHDIMVGQVLSYDLGPDGSSVTVHTFVRRPYDDYVTDATHFWNASGVSINLGAGGLRLQLESLQAVISGGIAFDTQFGTTKPQPSPAGHTFPLYPDQTTANEAGYRQRIKLVTYIEGSVRGLVTGAPVELYGIQIGTVTGIRLDLSDNGESSRVVVEMEVQPERFEDMSRTHVGDVLTAARALVKRGMRAQLRTASFITGQMLVAFDFVPNSSAPEPTEVDGAIVLPSVPGGLDSLTSSVTRVASKLEQLPLDQIGREVTNTLRGLDNLVNGREVRDTLASVATASKSLPGIGRAISAAADRGGKLVDSVDSGYGEGSQFRREVDRLLAQVSDTARSVRLLTDYLNEHPEALIRGRTDRGR